ncbi:dephospho-CoA kinase [Hyphobacterium sp. HN65]|uniref:Dephospho-CoA kinase n=1 Tax=Hyphobacterium lacteum TaxID=3116575 RepID=A0ABU7LRV0_9PROT|nr:dephospho-CoA kinase [Hyphobacterium sp. HN65]MEE2526633.1 dephospho-CoA kinase [Hyphobacterium sp. HN65]
MSPYKLGLTGSIGMGKSTTAKMFAEAGIPVFDSDAVVHALYAAGGDAVAPVEAAFPGVVTRTGISREKLSEALARDPSGFDRLNAIVHPLVAARRADFLEAAAKSGQDLVIFDIPLLFETGGEAWVDGVLVVTAPADIQAARVLERPGMTREKFAQILSRQMPDEEKRNRADFIIDTSKGFDFARKAVDELIAKLSHQSNHGTH